jgi:hypothetical protein
MRFISFIGATILLCLQLSPLWADENGHAVQATRFKIENNRIILVQNAGCDECKRRWRDCRNNCNTPSGFGPTYQQCLIICDTAGQACVQRFC